MSEKYDVQVFPPLPRNTDSRTRGHSCKLKVLRAKYDIRKYSFPLRIVNTWNSLSEVVVLSENINTFKNNLGKFWKNQDMLYNYEAEMSGTM